jgi:hypothetical protein
MARFMSIIDQCMAIMAKLMAIIAKFIDKK